MAGTVKLFVGGLPLEIASKEFIIELFHSIGAEPKEVFLLPQNNANPHSRSGFVRVLEDIADAIVEALNGTPLEGYDSPMIVRKADVSDESNCNDRIGVPNFLPEKPNWWEREGNWACEHCRNVNFSHRDICNRCAAPKPQHATLLPWDADAPSLRQSPAPIDGINGSWKCLECSNINFAMRTTCNRCRTPKPPESSKTVGELANGKWKCQCCFNVNTASCVECNNCQTLRPRQNSTSDDGVPSTEDGVLLDEDEFVGVDFGVGAESMLDAGLGTRNPFDEVDEGIDAISTNSSAKSAPALVPSFGRNGPVEGVDGNWKCKFCSNVNLGWRDACNRCRADNPERNGAVGSSASPTGLSTPDGKPIFVGRQGPVDGVDGNWKCPLCSNVNFVWRNECNRCQTPKDTTSSQVGSTVTNPVKTNNMWTCGMCGVVNFAEAESCNCCQSSNPSKGARLPSQPSTCDPNRGPVEGVDGNWKCELCRNINYDTREACNRCQAPKGTPTTSPLASLFITAGITEKPLEGVNGNWKCGMCSNVNLGWRELCNRCQSPPQSADGTPMPANPTVKRPRAPVEGVDGNWKCPACRNINYGQRETCNRCNGPKPKEQPSFENPLHPSVSQKGTWKCQLCSSVNSSASEFCISCSVAYTFACEEADFGNEPAAKRARV